MIDTLGNTNNKRKYKSMNASEISLRRPREAASAFEFFTKRKIQKTEGLFARKKN